MPISYWIDSNVGIVFTTATGVLTDEELLAHKRKLTADPGFKRGMVEVSDVREVTQLDVTPEGVRSFVHQDQLDAERLRDYKLAIVVSRDVVFGMARMYQTLTEENVPNVGVFRNLEEAKVWLGRV
jgi:hypothetical protein